MRDYFYVCKEIKSGWKYTTQTQTELPHETYYLTKTGAQTGPHAMSFDDSAWDTISVPHDLTADAPLSALENNYNGYVKRPDVWFRRTFYVDEAMRGKRILLRFLGVTGVSSFYVNGCLMTVNHSAFCAVELDVSDLVRFGPAVNLVSLYSDNHRPEGWWYQGTGIFRRVYLVATENTVIDPMSVRLDTEEDGDAWELRGRFGLLGRRGRTPGLRVQVRLFDAAGTEAAACTVDPEQAQTFALRVENPALWSVGRGNLYRCSLTLLDDERTYDCLERNVGFRTIRFDREKGFFLNGKRTEIRGMCYHEDEGNLGWNIGPEVYENRIRQMLAMGANAYRCSHNAPAEELLDLCDRCGVLVMDETRRFDTGEIAMKELNFLVRRDRCHPCVILWSIGNEEPWQGTEQGFRIAQTMCGAVHALDGARPVTMAMHNGFFGPGAGHAVDVLGVNYNHTDYDRIRKEYPDKPFIASEILNLADTVYENGNPYSGTDGALATLRAISERPYIAGSFGWAGAEYRGEHRNLGFFTDCCPVSCTGERKDGFYHYQAMWTDSPMVHICGHWNHRQGETQTVTVFSNAAQVSLCCNGGEVRTRRVNERREAVFEVPFEPGVLCAAAVSGGKTTAEHRLTTAGRPTALRLEPERQTLAADGNARMSIRIAAVDEDGNVTPTGSFFFEASVTPGAGIVCCDNDDPYCTAFAQKNTSVLYHGYGKIILQSGTEPCAVTVSVRSPGLAGSSCRISLEPAPSAFLEQTPCLYVNDWFVTHAWQEEPDIHAYTADIHYMKWKKYVDPCFGEVDQMPLFDRTGYVIYCVEPNMPRVNPGRTPAIVFEGITGDAKILINMRDFNNAITREYMCEKKEAPLAPVRVELPGAQEGERMIIKLVIHGTEPGSGITGAVRFEV